MDGDDEEIVTGTEGEVATGADAPEGDDDSEVSAEHADDQADDGESEIDAEPAAKPGRGETRIQRLANERAAEKARADRAEQELAEARRQQWQRQQAASEEDRQARRALMTPDERNADDLAQLRNEFAAQRRSDLMTNASMMDKAAFDAKAARIPAYARNADEVEKRFQELVRQGTPVEREIILKVLLGERALSGASDPKARRQAKGRVESQRVPAGSGKGDTASARGKAGETAEKRLQGVHI